MKIIKEENEIKQYIEISLAVHYKNQKLLPFLGAGFTKGEKTQKHTVLDASETQEKMVDLICRSESSLKKEDFSSLDFQRISNLFYKHVDKNEIITFLKNFFCKVSLVDYKKNLLSLNWKNIYTLNVDDAIENNSIFKTVLPYRTLNKDVLMQRVFKLHGDADYEIMYPDEQNIIFSRSQYIDSLNKNSSMLSCFREDYLSNNFLFIGCSLDNELDLEYAINQIEIKEDSNIDRIFLTHKEPNPIKKSELETYGINTIIVASSYDWFYETLCDCFCKIQFEEYAVFEEYKNIKIEIEKERNLNYNKTALTSTQNIKVSQNKIRVPHYFIKRTLSDKILSELNNNSINIVVGRRLSGKSFLALDIANNIHNKDVFLFVSNISVSVADIERILDLHNAILIFDTNTIGYDEMKFLAEAQKKLDNNQITVLLFINSSDRLLLSIPNTLIANCNIFELENIFDKQELYNINDKLSAVGLIKLKRHSTLIENIYSAKETYDGGYEFNLRQIVGNLTEKDIKILILSASSDRVYSSIYRQLSIKEADIESTIKKTNTVIELDYTEDIEAFQHSSWKTVVNSKAYLFRILGKYVEEGNQNINKVSNYIFDIVSLLVKDNRFTSFTKNITLFDNLNQIFWKKEGGGVINLIFKIYQKLETILYQDNQYWIQRAKSILYLKGKNEVELLNALIYAKKTYHDARDSSNMQLQSSFLISMIYGRLAYLTEFKNYLTDSIKWYYAALQESSYNHKYINDFITRAQEEKSKNDFYAICMFYLRNKQNYLDKQSTEKASFLVNKLMNWK
jgi:hypothetical protein